MSGPWSIKYELIRIAGKRRALLLEDASFYPPGMLHQGKLEGSATACELTAAGLLKIRAGFVWDFGSWPAINTPDVVLASLAHDAFCVMTDAGVLPWSVRAQADRYYRELLKQYGCKWYRRWWQWAGVRGYSKFVAYWRRKTYPRDDR